MKTLIKTIPLAVSLFFILLFIYASAGKIFDFENFQVQLAQSPLLSAYAGFVSYGVIILELVIVGLLCFNSTRFWGLFASFAMVAAFAIYIGLILTNRENLPCTCIGFFEEMTWKNNLLLNIGLMIFALAGILLEGRRRSKEKN